MICALFITSGSESNLGVTARAMDSPPLGPRPISALPSHLLNGTSPLHTSVGVKERQKLAASIGSSSYGRQPIDLEAPQGNQLNGNDSYIHNPKQQYGVRPVLHSNLSEVARDPRDGAPVATPPSHSRPASPYTLNPPVDFDGLSWPSECRSCHCLNTHTELTSIGLGTRERLEGTPSETEERLAKLEGAVKTILECIGEDPEREGLRGTPERYAKAMLFFTKGYEENVRDLVNGAVFHEDHDELVIVKDIEVFSLCEHHMVPFTGKVSDSLEI